MNVREGMCRGLAAAVLAFLFMSGGAQAQPADSPTAQAVEVITACLDAQNENSRRCIGHLSKLCRDKLPGGGNTLALTDCDASERRVWEAIIREELAKLSAGTIGRTRAEPANRPAVTPRRTAVMGRELIVDMHRSWSEFAPRKCDVEALQAEGGSYGRIVYGLCMMRTAGDHALWLRELNQDVESR